MSIHKRVRRNRERGLTLIEILVVITILGIIASIVGYNVMEALVGSKRDTTRIQMKSVADALDLYKIRAGVYPNTAEGLRRLASPIGPRGSVLTAVPRDGWDREFVYVSPGEHDPRRFDLRSLGDDGVAETADDVVSWDEPGFR